MPPRNSANSARSAQDEVVPNVAAKQIAGDDASASGDGSAPPSTGAAVLTTFQQSLQTLITTNHDTVAADRSAHEAHINQLMQANNDAQAARDQQFQTWAQQSRDADRQHHQVQQQGLQTLQAQQQANDLAVANALQQANANTLQLQQQHQAYQAQQQQDQATLQQQQQAFIAQQQAQQAAFALQVQQAAAGAPPAQARHRQPDLRQIPEPPSFDTLPKLNVVEPDAEARRTAFKGSRASCKLRVVATS